jgi:hypothetical protein
VRVHLDYEEDAYLDDFEEELEEMYTSIKAITSLELEVEEPLTVQSSMSITHVAAGEDRNLVVTSDGNLWVWGRGIGHLPIQVEELPTDHMRLGSGS